MKYYSFKIGKAIKNDYLLSICIIAVVVTLVIFAALMFFGAIPNIRRYGFRGSPKMLTREDSGFTALIILIVTTALCALAFCVRLLRLRKIVQSGNAVQAKIVSWWFYKDRGRIDFSYEYEGKTYFSGNAVMKNRDTELLKDKEAVTVFVNPQKPRKAIIAELYAASAL